MKKGKNDNKLTNKIKLCHGPNHSAQLFNVNEVYVA